MGRGGEKPLGAPRTPKPPPPPHHITNDLELGRWRGVQRQRGVQRSLDLQQHLGVQCNS